jgi:hypothetical protein
MMASSAPPTSGDFATENGLNIGHGRFFVAAYQSGALVLTVSR